MTTQPIGDALVSTLDTIDEAASGANIRISIVHGVLDDILPRRPYPRAAPYD